MDHVHHRDAVLTNAVKVFCTFVQHDVQRMAIAGITGSDKDMLAGAVKNQMMKGCGGTISTIMDRVMTDPQHLPTFTDPEQQQMLAVIMAGYEDTLHAMRQGPCAANAHRSGPMLESIMQTAAHVGEAECTEDALDEFTEQVYDSTVRWNEFTPDGPFQEIVHGMVLKAEND
mgnify:FL=1